MSDFSRRKFIQATAVTAAAATLAAAIPSSTSHAQQQPTANGGADGAAGAAGAGKKLGYALVGLGRLTIGQLLPAFASCQHARVTALVSGHPDKASDLATKYGVPEK